MIRYLKMENFRGVQSGTLEELTSLVVLVGPNGSGKSTVLDALLLGGAQNSLEALQVAANRRHSVGPNKSAKSFDEADFGALFYKSAPYGSVSVRTETGARRVVLRASGIGVEVRSQTSASPILGDRDISPEEFFSDDKADRGNRQLPGVYNVEIVDSRTAAGSGSLEEAYTLVSQRGLRKEVKSFVTEMLPDVEDLEILAPKNVPTLHLNFKDHALPIGLAGDGIQLLLRLVMMLTSRAESTILLEEPETHMHPGAIRLVARAIHAAVARGVQVVLTTHSLELIDALTLGRPDEELKRVAVYRIALDEGQLKTTRLDGQEVALARSSIEDDLR
ncbi:MAG TPA: AAA family ATPase [Tepidisphaeraceae bacterium]|nr:AAA family ATPase [Tepidisphaeraceae bacterium]